LDWRLWHPQSAKVSFIRRVGVADDLHEVAQRGHDRGYLVLGHPALHVT